RPHRGLLAAAAAAGTDGHWPGGAVQRRRPADRTGDGAGRALRDRAVRDVAVVTAFAGAPAQRHAGIVRAVAGAIAAGAAVRHRRARPPLAGPGRVLFPAGGIAEADPADGAGLVPQPVALAAALRRGAGGQRPAGAAGGADP